MSDIQTAVEQASNATIAKGGAVVSVASGGGTAIATYLDPSTVVSYLGGGLAIVAAILSIVFAIRDERRKKEDEKRREEKHGWDALEHKWKLREATPTGLNSPSDL